MKFYMSFLLIVGLLVVTINGQPPCRNHLSFCLNTRECCPPLECSFRDNKCLYPGSCRTWGQYCTSDVSCCAGHRCHPVQQKCVRTEELCSQFNQICNAFQQCCWGTRCINGRCGR
ncbi:egg protein CP422-like [Leptopilina heterotoma]|uniref:egg protein CP422-like n=1 Tax=Leptopilina heterotoma TaxID=63436 RepID=UPI001CA8294D|nr:egg protein CP422-like [Leptopilina heterotoma]